MKSNLRKTFSFQRNLRLVLSLVFTLIIPFSATAMDTAIMLPQYCLVVDNVVCRTGDDEQELLSYVESLSQAAKDSYKEETFQLGTCEVQPYDQSEWISLSDDEVVELLQICPANYIAKTRYEEIPYETIYTAGEEGKVLQEGKNGKIQYSKNYVYANRYLQRESAEIKTAESSPVPKIIGTYDCSLLPENTAKLDASILDVDLSQYQIDFINQILPEAKKGYKEHNILISLTLAQSILESGWGDYSIGNNLFGIKAYGWEGKQSIVETQEFDAETNENITITAAFRNYDSYAESVADYHDLLSLDNYSEARNCNTYKEAARAVQAAGYATNPEYADSLINLIEKYKLYTWDKVDVLVP